jgi:hypothetical protein
MLAKLTIFGRRQKFWRMRTDWQNIQQEKRWWLSRIIRKELEINWKLNYFIRRESTPVYIYVVASCNRWTNIYFEIRDGTHENWSRRRWSPKWQRQLFKAE